MSTSIVSSLGAGSGIDTTKLVSQLVETERAPRQKAIDQRAEQLSVQISGYGQLKSSLSELESGLSALANPELFQARNVSVPDSSVITANKVDPGAQTGTYRVEVKEVASAQSLAMAAQTSRDGALGLAGDVTIRFGEWTYDAGNNPQSFAVNDKTAALTVNIEAGDSLDSIAAKINEAGEGVQASVIKVDDNYQLMLTSDSGAKQAMELTVSDPALNAFAYNSAQHAEVTQTQQAQDAKLSVNGLTVSRASNEITDVIAGLSFTLNRAAPGETLTFDIKADKSLGEQAVRDFVESYNSFLTTAQGLVGYSRNEDNELVRGALASDSTARMLVDQVRGLVGAAVPGVASGFNALTNLGIRTERDGTISINETEFSAAISSNFKAVEQLFSLNTSATDSAVSVNLGTYAKEAAGGTYAVALSQAPTRGQVSGNAIGAGFPLDTSTGDYGFTIKVNGATSNRIELTGSYDSPEDLRADLQSLINGDSKLKAVGATLDVLFDSGSNSFSFVSRDYGAASSVSFTEVGADAAGLGLATDLVRTAGKDVAGAIDGVAAFGAGNILLPAVGSAPYGLNLSVGENAANSFEFSFSRGFAGELSRLIDNFSGSEGIIKMREDNLGTQLEDLDLEREDLDRRMESVNQRLTAQFVAMEAIVSSLQATGRQLDGLVDRLPFTAKS